MGQPAAQWIFGNALLDIFQLIQLVFWEKPSDHPPHEATLQRSSNSVWARRCSEGAEPWVLAVAIPGSSMAFIDATVVNVALPALQATLGGTVVDVQWVVGGEVVDPKFVTLVVERHAFVIPTFSVLESVCNESPGQHLLDDSRLSSYVAADYLAQLKKNINHGQPHNCMFSMTAIPPLAGAHVRILAGTDAGNPGTAPGISMHGELEYLVKAGLTAEQALAAATSVPAATFHLTDRGRIASGLRADLVLVNGDATANITAVRDIVEVWKAGTPVNRKSWR